jgi:AraC-like DNA-binding protein
MLSMAKEMTVGLVPILNAVGVAHALLLMTALVCLRRGNRAAHLLLASLLLVIAILVTGGILTNTRMVLAYPHLGQLHTAFRFLAAPLFFFYVKSLVDNSRRFRRQDLFHLLPFVVCLIYLAPFYVSSASHKEAYLSAALQSFPIDWYTRTALGFCQDAIYIGAAFLLMRRVQQSASESDPVRDSRTPIYGGDLLLVRCLLISFAFVWILGVGRFIFAYRVETNLMVPLALSLTTYLIGFLALVRPQIFLGRDESVRRRYEKSSLTPEMAERYLVQLQDFMRTEKPYCDGNLTLQKLARRLSMSSAHLSQIINERLEQNFIDFINSYRVEEAKRRLTDPAKRRYSIIAIAEQSGFNSKSAFNTAFKKYANRTPSQFRNEQASSQKEPLLNLVMSKQS